MAADKAEQHLIDLCRSGDGAAWEVLFEQHYASAGRFVYQLAPDLSREDVEEICQEAFVSVVKNIGNFKGGCRLQTWIFRIAANKARDYREKRRAAKRGGGQRPLSLDDKDPETGLGIDPVSPRPMPDEELLHAENVMLVGYALDEMHENCREVIALRYFGDCSYKEISDLLNLNQRTVSSRLSKCLEKLEDLMRDKFSGRKQPVYPSNY